MNRLPEHLLQSLENVNGFNRASFVQAHENPQQIVSVRFNPSKLHKSPQEIFSGAEKVPWSTCGYYLPTRPSFTLDPLLHAGVYYVQEASGMFIEQCIRQHADLTCPLRVLDLCAAPGGKSTLIQSIISERSLLVSNEVIRSRVNVLVENTTKWGADNVVVTSNDPKHFERIPDFFDVMVVDAPCSGSGLFRRDADAIKEWSSDAVEMCSLRQQRILSDSFSSLKAGGLLVYSTCSYSREENEDLCDWIIDHFDVQNLPVAISDEWNIVRCHSNAHAVEGYRFFPDKIKGEGFFVACFRKNGLNSGERRARKTAKVSPAPAGHVAEIRKWITNMDRYVTLQHEERLFIVPSVFHEELQTLQSNLYVKKAGIGVGTIMRGDLIPAHDLAVSHAVATEQLLTVVLKKEEALQYLRKEEVRINTPGKGWCLARYDNQNIGWLKLLGNRSNNYYPREWRILKTDNN